MNNYAFCFKDAETAESNIHLQLVECSIKRQGSWQCGNDSCLNIAPVLIWPIPLSLNDIAPPVCLSVSNSLRAVGRRCYQATLLPVRSIIAHGRAAWCCCCWCWGARWCCIQTARGTTPRLDSPTKRPASISSNILLETQTLFVRHRPP